MKNEKYLMIRRELKEPIQVCSSYVLNCKKYFPGLVLFGW
jgi:hypothetical protein